MVKIALTFAKVQKSELINCTTLFCRTTVSYPCLEFVCCEGDEPVVGFKLDDYKVTREAPNHLSNAAQQSEWDESDGLTKRAGRRNRN